MQFITKLNNTKNMHVLSKTLFMYFNNITRIFAILKFQYKQDTKCFDDLTYKMNKKSHYGTSFKYSMLCQ